MDVIKVRRQLSPSVDCASCKRSVACGRKCWIYPRDERGVLNMAPSGALIITVYELVKRLSKQAPRDQEQDKEVSSLGRFNM